MSTHSKESEGVTSENNEVCELNANAISEAHRQESESWNTTQSNPKGEREH